jgi:hypothetical protein
MIVERTAEEGPPAGLKFRVIRFGHVLEHLPDPRGVLESYRSVIESGGELIVALPNVSCIQAKLFGAKWFQYEIPRHLYHFSVPTLRALVERAGYRVKRVWQYFLPFMSMTSLNRIAGGHWPVRLPGIVLGAPWWSMLHLADEMVLRASP